MAEFVSKYASKQADENGIIAYTAEEHETWRILYDRMMKLVPTYACAEFNEGLKKLDITGEQIPQLPHINNKLRKLTGWGVEPVPALIPLDDFFYIIMTRIKGPVHKC